MSSAGQRDAQTIASQLRVLPEYVERQGWTLVGTYIDDGKSAATGNLAQRDGFSALVRDANAGKFDVLVVSDIDRLTRGDIGERGDVLSPFQRAGIAIATPSSGVQDLSSLTGEMTVLMRSVFAAEDKRKIAERTRIGKATIAKAGGLVGGRHPYGLVYDRERRSEQGWTVDAAKAAAAVELMQRLAAGESCERIALDFDDRRIPAPGRGGWNRSRVWDIASSRHLIGEYSADRKGGVVARVPAIVDVALFERVKLALASRKKNPKSRSQNFYLAERLGACGMCGGRMMIRSGSLAKGSRAAYVCAGRRDATCIAPTVLTADADALIWQSLCAQVDDPNLLPTIAAESDSRARDAHDWGADAAGYRKRLAAIEKLGVTLWAQHRRGLVTEAVLTAELAAQKRERDMLAAQLATAEHAQSLKSGAKHRLVAAKAFLEAFRARMSDASPARRREVILTVVRRDGITFEADGSIRVAFMFPLIDQVPGSRPVSGHCPYTGQNPDRTLGSGPHGISAGYRVGHRPAPDVERFMLARIAVVLCLASIAVANPSSTPASQQVDVTGDYHSNWDDVRLVQDGNRVTGTYVCCGGGKIEGRIVEGRVLRYQWTQPGGHGLGVWTIRGGRLDGTWGNAQSTSSGGRWDLVRAKSRGQIAN